MTVVVLPSTIMVTSHVHYLDRLACGNGKGAAQAQETKGDAAVAEMSDISSSPYSVQISQVPICINPCNFGQNKCFENLWHISY